MDESIDWLAGLVSFSAPRTLSNTPHGRTGEQAGRLAGHCASTHRPNRAAEGEGARIVAA